MSAHESLLTQSSDFVQVILTIPCKDSTKPIIRLPDHEPETFALFINWLYYKEKPVVGETSEELFNIECWQLCKAWILGQKLQCPAFQNAVTSDLVEEINDYAELLGFDNRVIAYVYEHTRLDPTANLRQLIFQAFYNFGQAGWVSRDNGDMNVLPKGFVFDLAEWFLEVTDWRHDDPMDRYIKAKWYLIK
ncbi:hypothetical protein BDV19DRAFT_385627 [Aspergillus venezuelensis]